VFFGYFLKVSSRKKKTES